MLKVVFCPFRERKMLEVKIQFGTKKVPTFRGYGYVGILWHGMMGLTKLGSDMIFRTEKHYFSMNKNNYSSLMWTMTRHMFFFFFKDGVDIYIYIYIKKKNNVKSNSFFKKILVHGTLIKGCVVHWADSYLSVFTCQVNWEIMNLSYLKNGLILYRSLVISNSFWINILHLNIEQSNKDQDVSPF